MGGGRAALTTGQSFCVYISDIPDWSRFGWEGVGTTGWVVVGVGIVTTVVVGWKSVVVGVGVVGGVRHFRPSSSKARISAVVVCEKYTCWERGEGGG